MKIQLAAALGALGLLAAPAHASCGTDFCGVNTHWDAQGLSSDDGLRVDLRYSQARADRLRAGSTRISPAAPSGSDAEIENRRTVNRLLNLDADYAINARWNLGIGLPLVMRDHRHTFDAAAGAFTQQSDFRALGDIRVTGTYKFDLGSMNSGAGLRFGFKLPTGATNKSMSPPDPADPATPYPLERSAQPGSGSTDAILGAYYFGNRPAAGWGWFASGQLQSALATRADFRPGSEVRLDVGAHYALAPSLNALLQLNAQHRQRDGGANANRASGGHSLNLSPGLGYALTPNSQLYGLVQFALKQYVHADPAEPGSGQLTAPWSFTLGLTHRF